MTIAITGPENFAFQDLVCVDMAYRCRNLPGARFVPEPKSGEDGLLSWRDASGITQTAEIQVKGAQGVASLDDLANYLAHFPEHSSGDCLFERLLRDPDRRAVFVLSARCDDQLLPFRHVSPDSTEFSARTVSKTVAKIFLTKLLAINPGLPGTHSSALNTRRKKAIAKLKGLSSADVASALSRVFIIELENKASVEVRLQSALRAHRIDTLSLRGAIGHLNDIVTQAKRGQTDIIAPIVERVRRLAPDSIAAPGYLTRGLEISLGAVLNKELVLLLGGQPRTGKTWLAKQLASALQDIGFEVRTGTHVDEAERFLTDAADGERAYLLDDPLGSREPGPRASNSLANLRTLIDRIPRNRRLIVAQSESVLLQVARQPNLIRCALGTHYWHPVNALDREAALEVWFHVADLHKVPEDISGRIRRLISEGNDLHDVGAIAYLAQTISQLPANPSDQDIIRQARSDASDFIFQLAEINASFKALLRAVALATNSAEGAADRELAFIINGGDKQPGLVPEISVRSLFGDKAPFPAYAPEPALTDDQASALDALQRRRVVDDISGKTSFSHPYLRAGAQALLRPETRREKEHVKALAMRSIASLSARVSLAAARNLFWMRALLPSDDNTGLSETFGVARAGLRSIFPATRDESFSFLTSFAGELPLEDLEEIPHWAERVLVNLEDIDVAQGSGFINKSGYPFLESEALSTIQPYLDALESGQPLGLDLVLSKRLLATLRDHPRKMGAATMMRFLAADEALVRAEAARIWFEIPRRGDPAVIAKLLNDSAPVIAVALLKQLGRRWKSMSASRRRALLGLLAHQAQNPAIASVLFVRLVVLDRVEHFGYNPPYVLLTSLMPHVLRSLPESISFKDGRLLNVVNEAIKSGVRDGLEPVLAFWSKNIVTRLRRSQLSEYDLAVIDPLIAALSVEKRRPILEELLSVDDTGALVVFISSLLDDWVGLADTERDAIRAKLEEPREDQRWLRAIVLTASSPPMELLQVLTGRKTRHLKTAEMQHLLSADQFNAAFYTHIGWPQPLWWYGTHHRNSPFWTRAITDLAARPAEPLFAAAFAEVIRGGGAKLAATIRKLPDHAIDRAFELLLDATIATQSYLQNGWVALAERGKTAGRLETWGHTIGQYAEAFEDLGTIVRLFGKTNLTGNIISHLRPDFDAYDSVRNFTMIHDSVEQVGHENEQIPAQNVTMFRSVVARQFLKEFESSKPRLCGTWDLIVDKLEEFGATAQTLDEAKHERDNAYKRHRMTEASRSSFPPEPVLHGWRDYKSRT